MTEFLGRRVGGTALAALLALAPMHAALAAGEQQNLEELRNTVVNLLQALVEQGVMTRAKAEDLVKQAQAKAAESAAATARADAGAVRVPYVPQIVKDEISKQVSEQVKPAVVADVIDTAKTEGWGVPGALPDWIGHIKLYGDVTVRGQADLYAADNAQYYFIDFQSVNQAGGLSKAGLNEFLNVSEDRYRLRLRARFGAEAQLGSDLSAGIRLATGSLTDPGSASQTLGTTSGRYTVGVDQAYVRWDPRSSTDFRYATAVGGRIPNPWFAPTELIYARDLTLEGVAFTGRYGLGDGSAGQPHAYLTLGALPVQEVPLANPNSKWLLGAQLGSQFEFGGRQRLRLALAYYNFEHVSGVRNEPDSTLLNYTAPQFIRYGNSVFDIANSTTDPSVNLFALATRFRLVNIAGSYDVPVGRYMLTVTGDVVRNVGATESDIFNRTGSMLPARNKGFVGEFVFGDQILDTLGTWRAKLGYRYVQADAVLDSWTDADFHGGGTNARGYYVWTEFGLARGLSTRLRYLSGNEVDGPHYGYDIIQLDLLSNF